MIHPVSDPRRRFLEMSLAAAGMGAMCSKQTRAANLEQGEVAAPARGGLYLAIYRPGPGWIAGQPLAAQPLKEHGRYMLDLYRKGALRFAGGFGDGSGGAAAFEAVDDEAAAAVIEADPAVTSKVFVYEVHRWALVAWGKFK
jgi:uncharacterized protein YciI